MNISWKQNQEMVDIYEKIKQQEQEKKLKEKQNLLNKISLNKK